MPDNEMCKFYFDQYRCTPRGVYEQGNKCEGCKQYEPKYKGMDTLVHYIGYHKDLEGRKPMGTELLDSETAYCGFSYHFKSCTDKLEETTCKECLVGFVKACRESDGVLTEEMMKNSNFMETAIITLNKLSESGFKKKSSHNGYWKEPNKEHCRKCERTMPMKIKEGRMGGLIVVCIICETLSETQKATWTNGDE